MSEATNKTKGSFTLPGESGYEKLTLELADKWGADVIRDSDGTALSDEILNAGYGIYSTICIIRDHNEWAKQNPDKLQQTFLITQPKVAVEGEVSFRLLDDFFEEQFRINDTAEAMKYWQVYDRTTGEEADRASWHYCADSQTVTVTDAVKWHKYTVSFLAYRIWEEISMYNHTTNNWQKEHLMQIDPVYEETQQFMLEWMENWCKEHPMTTVVRFTSMFYNFVWIWGHSEKNRSLFTDWGSYDFTVSARALDNFADQYGYSLTAEDFVNKGKYHVTHMPADGHKRDWMEFVNEFVVGFGSKLVDIVHRYGKQAYVFYDDSWVGVEPYHERFAEFGFDGLIKCVFSGYEARLCAGVKVKTHELRLHPYLFPVGLGGSPTFMEGGDPTLEAKKYWNSVRRALLRAPIDRIGLGGYLHLVEGFPDFCDYIEKVSDEFRRIKGLHKQGNPVSVKPRVAVLHYWGGLRPWTLSGHFHETYMHDLIHIDESLSGLPVDVSFINFEDVKNGRLAEFDVVINAGRMGSAWSGGDVWKDTGLVDLLTEWVYNGGLFLGVGEPSAVEGCDTTFRMAHVLGVDEDLGDRVNHGRWAFDVETVDGLLPDGAGVEGKDHIYLTDGNAQVLMESEGLPVITANRFGKGAGIYLASYQNTLENTRMLLNLILYGAGEDLKQECLTDNAYTECAYYPAGKTLVMMNNSDKQQKTAVTVEGQRVEKTIEPYDTLILKL